MPTQPRYFKPKEMELGYAKLEDGTIILCRVAVINVRPIYESSPFGIDFDLDLTTGISPQPSEEAREQIKDKPVLPPGEKPPNNWKQLEIKEKKAAVEKIEYEDERTGKYLITVEVEPIMASLNTAIKTIKGDPLYVIRWVPKITWKKLQ